MRTANGKLVEHESMTFSGFGGHVDVQPPDPSQIVAFSQVKDQISSLVSGQGSS